MIRLSALLLLSFAVLCMITCTARAQYSVIHTFGGIGDGVRPSAGLTFAGGNLYGTTLTGGTDGLGTIYRVNPNGSDYAVLHSFSGYPVDGSKPISNLIFEGDALYGMSSQGGTQYFGTLFRTDLGGTDYSVVRNLKGWITSPGEAGTPTGDLVRIGATLFGTSQVGGDTGPYGTVYKINTDGTGHAVLHSFAPPPNDGYSPTGGLILAGTTFYGTTTIGGIKNKGTVFKVDLDGSGYTILHSFDGPGSDGEFPYGNLTLVDSMLYGTTEGGGPYHGGTVFKIDTDGANYSILHSFNSLYGSSPWGAMTLVGPNLYGTTATGGEFGLGVLFQMNLDGSGYSVVHNFSGAGDGRSPQTSLTLVGSVLYGATSFGGANNSGIIFRFEVPEPPGALLANIVMIAALLYRRHSVGRNQTSYSSAPTKQSAE